MATIFHLALAADWTAAQEVGSYTISTRGRSLAEEGFIHASRGDQWPGVRARFYADVTEPLVLLQIDTDLLGVPLIEEPAVPGGTETFPHIYGPLPVAAVVKAIPLDAAASTPEPARPQRAAPVPTPGSSTAAAFARTYFQEMFANAALVLMVVALGFAGLVIGSGIDNETSGQQGLTASLGGLAGVGLGTVAAVLLYRRRTRR